MRLGFLVLIGCGRVGFDPAAKPAPDAGESCVHLACDGFESGELADIWTPVQLAGATIEISTERPHTGAFSITMASAARPSTGSETSIRFPLAFGTQPGTVAARAYVSLDGPLQDFIAVLSMGSDNLERYLNAGGDSLGNWTVTEGSAPVTDYQSTIATPPVGTWVCIELDHTPSGVTLFVEDAPAVQLVPQVATFDQIAFGVTRANREPYRAYVDDVVISDRHIGCE